MQQTNQSTETVDPQGRLDSSVHKDSTMTTVERDSQSTSKVFINVGSSVQYPKESTDNSPASQPPKSQTATPRSKGETFHSFKQVPDDLPALEAQQGNQRARIAASDGILILGDEEDGEGNVDNQNQDDVDQFQSPSTLLVKVPSCNCGANNRDLSQDDAHDQSCTSASLHMTSLVGPLDVLHFNSQLLDESGISEAIYLFTDLTNRLLPPESARLALEVFSQILSGAALHPRSSSRSNRSMGGEVLASRDFVPSRPSSQ